MHAVSFCYTVGYRGSPGCNDKFCHARMHTYTLAQLVVMYVVACRERGHVLVRAHSMPFMRTLTGSTDGARAHSSRHLCVLSTTIATWTLAMVGCLLNLTRRTCLTERKARPPARLCEPSSLTFQTMNVVQSLIIFTTSDALINTD